MNNKETIIIVAYCMFVTSLLTWLFTEEHYTQKYQEQAVKRGHAHWEPDPANGHNVFKWN